MAFDNQCMLTLALALTLAGSEVRLAPGSQDVLRVPGVSKVAVGNPSVADVTVTNRGELLVLGKQQGRTSLTLWTPSGVQTRTIVVDDGKGGEIAKMVREMVGPGLRVEQYNGITVIDGTLDSITELQRLRTLVGDDASVKLLVRLNPRVLPLVAEQITNAFHKQGLRDAQAVCIGQKIFLEGSVADDKELQKALRIADAYYGQATTGLMLR